MQESFFWADQKAKEILDKKSYHFIDKAIPERKIYIVKTSASLSGVLHIGRLSDTIRADSIVTALGDAGAKTRMIWVAEDTDPLRKVPEGVPRDYERYLGMPVTDVPDPAGCHGSYAEHHQAEYLEVIDEFITTKVRKHSTREEYRKGSFRPYIRRLLDRRDEVTAILEKYRDTSLAAGWSPWQPICSNCGKVITPKVLDSQGTWVKYECRDYRFEATLARGCGHVGEADAVKDDGKLLWKGEWASEWALWNVSCEGGGKEYEVPTSAWWVNGEICERILDSPMPTPYFYEHLLVDGKKMSASVGNVVYPSEWLKVAPPELLRFLYNKKLMKTRSFSWQELPRLYDDYDKHAAAYYGDLEIPNEKERSHMVRLYRISQLKPPPNERPPPLDFSFASLLAQVYDPATRMEDVKKALERAQVSPGPWSNEGEQEIARRLVYGLNWARDFVPGKTLALADAPDERLVAGLTKDEKLALSQLSESIAKDARPDSVQSAVFEAARTHAIKPARLFQILYRIVVGQDSGPRFGPLVAALGPERVSALLSVAGSA